MKEKKYKEYKIKIILEAIIKLLLVMKIRKNKINISKSY
jgi:hypothetical protein